MKNLTTFTKAQLKQRGRWWSAREELDAAVSKMAVVETWRLSQELSESVEVSPPHQAIILPELYLHYSSVFLFGNKSLSFRVFADKIIHNELKAKAKRKTKRRTEK